VGQPLLYLVGQPLLYLVGQRRRPRGQGSNRTSGLQQRRGTKTY
jgi:hypothetical protein